MVDHELLYTFGAIDPFDWLSKSNSDNGLYSLVPCRCNHLICPGHTHPYAHVSVKLEDLGNFVESSTKPFTVVEGAYSLKEYLKVCPNDRIIQRPPLC